MGQRMVLVNTPRRINKSEWTNQWYWLTSGCLVNPTAESIGLSAGDGEWIENGGTKGTISIGQTGLILRRCA